MKDKTLDYYNQNADSFVESTVSVDFKKTQDKFIEILPGKRVLDFGCGSGRDTKYFIEAGLDVTATDGSEELCKSASEYTGIKVKQMLFQELNEIDKYDGIIYTSLKYGNFEGERNGRFFTDFTLDTFEEFVQDINNITIDDYWITGDVRPGREEEKWLNLILRKTNS